jgi:signal transduction histidine kinase
MAADDEVLQTSHEQVRLTQLHLTGLLDSPPEAAFDRLTELVCRLLEVPMSLVALPDTNRQFFKSVQGLGEPWASARETRLSHSFCQHVVAAREPLVIEDARLHPLVRDNLAIRDLGVIAYLGIPLFTPDGYAVATLCAIDRQPRRWIDDDINTVGQLAELAMTEIALKFRVKERDQANAALQTLNQELDLRVRERTKEVVALAAELARAEQRERHRIAQHLHDSLQQELFAAQFALHNLRKQATLESEEMQAAAEEAYKLITGAIALAREATSDLSPPTLPGGAFVQTLQRLTTALDKRYGLQVELSVSESLPEPNEMTCGLLLPLLRELLFNVVKHAGVNQATLSLSVLEGEVAVTVSDGGQGFNTATLQDPQVSNLGLHSVRERLHLLGGRLLVDSDLGKGTRASIFIPVEFFTLTP